MQKNLDLNLELEYKLGEQTIHFVKKIPMSDYVTGAMLLADAMVTMDENTGIVSEEGIMVRPVVASYVIEHFSDADMSKYTDEDGNIDFFNVYDDYVDMMGHASFVGVDYVMLFCEYYREAAKKRKDELLQCTSVGVQLAKLTKELAKVGNTDLGVIRGILSTMMLQQNKKLGTKVEKDATVVDLSAFKVKK